MRTVGRLGSRRCDARRFSRQARAFGAIAAAALLAIALGGCAWTATTPHQAMSEVIDPSHDIELMSVEMMGNRGERGLLDVPDESAAASELLDGLDEGRCTYLRNEGGAAWSSGGLYTLTVREAEAQENADELSFTSDGRMYVGSSGAVYSLESGDQLYNLCSEVYKDACEMGGEPW